MKVVVFQGKCIASGNCVMRADQVFDQRDDDGLVTLLDENPAPGQADAVRLAAEFCPAQAIQIEE
ncbi:ferredoxin [Nocardia sp. SYP-A9097]|uniref:ferredoxin n=1 Tax=Nocardia sp. SYP-A9097 TaxID=2663237 RepID=UPI00129A7EF5|nr:ferredoxin [Nocardia sp. SYP-A9097]MRH86904.1 ferredoxin [Nocardia sp. SYP-A9097]